MSTTVNVTARRGPYVGPRAYEEGEHLYGRDRDITRVTDLLVAERIVLLYSPSGAGKTSLIRAAIVPELRREDFVVLPMIRVTNPLPPALDVARNRYVMSTLLSLEEAQPEESQLALDVLVTMTLGDYLEQRQPGVDGLVLIFDQFEELLTNDSTDVEEKAAFLDQVGAALRNRGRWALFSMREDWIAGLDPFTRAIPTRLANTYRLDLLGETAARAAVTQPAADAGVHFSEAAATKLVNDLRRVRVQRQDVASEELGPSVEPVQLQVVCSRLWDGLPEGTTEIDEADVEHAGDVDAALAGYYADRVAAAASQTGVSERAIRDWIETALVTEQGFRDQALHGPEVAEGDAARSVEVLHVLEDAHLLRSETGRGAAWYELAHDRLIEPILADNATWRDEHLTPFQRAAAVWDSYKQDDNFLLSGDALVEAERWSEDQSTELTQLEQKFITESRDARRAADRDRRVRRRLRLAVVGMAVALCVALVVGIWGWVSAERAGRERDRADQEALIGAAIASTAGIADPNPRILLPLRAHELLDADELSPTLRSALYAGLTGTPIDVGFKAGLPIHGVTFTPSGLVAFVREGGAISLWDPATGEHVRDVVSETAGFDAKAGVRFSRDGRLVALPDVNGMISIVDTQAGAKRDELESVALGVKAFSGDGRHLAYELSDGVAVSTLGTGDVETVPTDVPFAAALDRAGTRLVTVGVDGQVSLYAVGSPDPVAQTDVPDGDTVIAEFSPADDSFVTSTLSGELIIWDAATGAELQRISGHEGSVLTATYNPAGNVLVTTGSDNQLRAWDLLDGTEIASVPRVVTAGTPTRIGFNPRDPDQLVVASAFGAGAMRLPASHAGPVWALAHSANGLRIASAGGDGEVRVWNAEGELLQRLAGSGGVFNTVALNADGSVAATGDETGSVYVFDVASGKARFTRSTDGAVWSVAIDEDGRYVAAAGEDGVHVWDIEDGETVADIDGHTGTVLDVAFRPGSGGRELVTASQDQTAVHWHLNRGATAQPPPSAPVPGPREDGLENAPPERVDTFRSDETGWFSLAISPDGQRLALGGDDGDVVLQDLEGGGAEQEEIELHADAVYDIGFSADGRRLVTTSADGRAIIVDARNGEAIAQIASPTTAFFAAAFDPNGETVTLGGSDGKVYRVPLRDRDLIAAASVVATRDLEPGECERYLLTECPLE